MKHKHYDMIIEWANDTTQVYQYRNGTEWIDCGDPTWHESLEYRKKPREFNEGYYPVMYHDDLVVAQYMGNVFSFLWYADYFWREVHVTEELLDWIGEKIELETPNE